MTDQKKTPNESGSDGFNNQRRTTSSGVDVPPELTENLTDVQADQVREAWAKDKEGGKYLAVALNKINKEERLAEIEKYTNPWPEEYTQNVWDEEEQRFVMRCESGEFKNIDHQLRWARTMDDMNDNLDARAAQVRDTMRSMHFLQATQLPTEDEELKREMLVEDMIPTGVPAILAAGGGVGKTFMLLDLAMKVASAHPFTGKPSHETWLGQEVLKRGNVVLFLAEDDRIEVGRRMREMGYHSQYGGMWSQYRIITITIPDMYEYFGGSISHKLGTTSATGGAGFTKFADHWMDVLSNYPDLAMVVFDPLQSFFDWKFDADNVAADMALKWAHQVAIRTKAAVIFTHHLSKESVHHVPPKTPRAAVGRIRGASNIVNSARCVIPVWSPEVDVCKDVAEKFTLNSADDVFCAGLGKSNYGGDTSVHWLLRDPDTGLLVDRTEDVTGVVDKFAGVPRKDRIVQWAYEKVESFTFKDVQSELSLSKGTVNRAIGELIKEGAIIRAKRGHYLHPYKHPNWTETVSSIMNRMAEMIELSEHGYVTQKDVTQMFTRHKDARNLLYKAALRSLIAHDKLVLGPEINPDTKREFHAYRMGKKDGGASGASPTDTPDSPEG